MVFKTEHELEQAATPFLYSKFNICAWQVPLYNRLIDFVAIVKSGNLISIEFKLKDWKRALIQAKTNSNAFDFVYICVPGGNYLEKLKIHAQFKGIGVFIYDIDNETLKIELPAQKVERQWPPNVEFIKSYLKIRGKSEN